MVFLGILSNLAHLGLFQTMQKWPRCHGGPQLCSAYLVCRIPIIDACFNVEELTHFPHNKSQMRVYQSYRVLMRHGTPLRSSKRHRRRCCVVLPAQSEIIHLRDLGGRELQVLVERRTRDSGLRRGRVQSVNQIEFESKRDGQAIMDWSITEEESRTRSIVDQTRVSAMAPQRSMLQSMTID